MDKQQLAEMRAGAASNAIKETEDPAFFTGKPYLNSEDGYAFKYRSYSPRIARWTSEDPSGFPDGANASFYAPNPTSEIDYLGLWKLQIVGQTTTSSFNDGTIQIGGYSHKLYSSSLLETNDITTTSTGTTGTAKGYFSGSITKMDGTPERNASGDVDFSISVNSSGQISISATSGGYDTVDRSLQIGASWSKDIGNRTATLTFASASIYGGSGISGLGFQANGAIVGGGASVSWTNPAGKVSTFTTLTFQAVE